MQQFRNIFPIAKNADLIIDSKAINLSLQLIYIASANQKKMTVFIVSQRTASVLSADLILVLDDGQLVGKGTHDMLMETCPIYQEIYYSQFPEKRKEAVQNV